MSTHQIERNISVSLQGPRKDACQTADALRTIDGIVQFLTLLSATKYAQERKLWPATYSVSQSSPYILVSKNLTDFPMLIECLGKWAFGNVDTYHRNHLTSRLYISSQISAGCLLARSLSLNVSPVHESVLADRQTWIQILQENQHVPYLLLVPLLKLLPSIGSSNHHVWMMLRGMLAKSCCEKVSFLCYNVYIR